MRRSLKSGEMQGQSLVELGISLMIMILLLLGAVDFGIALFQYVAIRDAASEGAIYGSFQPDKESGIQFRAAATAADVVPLDPENDVTVTINGDACQGFDASTPPVPNSVTVSVSFDHDLIFPLVGSMIGTNTIPLRASATNTILTPQCAP